MNTTTDFVRLLGAIRGHLTAFDLPHEIASINADIGYLDGERITVHLTGGQGLTPLASGLIAWAYTLTEVSVTAWRVPDGKRVHLTVSGRLVDQLAVQVYGGVSFDPETFGPDLEPGGQQNVSLGTLRAWAATEGVAA